MQSSTLECQNTKVRREKLRDSDLLNGIDYVEYQRDARVLKVYLIHKADDALEVLFKSPERRRHIQISGGRRIPFVKAEEANLVRDLDSSIDDCIDVTLSEPNDFSNYTLSLVGVDSSKQPTKFPMPGIDPRYSQIVFNFKEECPSDLDCKSQGVCPISGLQNPDLNYLAKDYSSFRQLLLDRLSQIMPDWKERHIPDIGITLVEILAYAGDHLSYFQDAVATEAYLDTARRRISVRRHTRLVDYAMHEGCNSRTWLHIFTSSNLELIPDDIFFITGAFDRLSGQSIIRRSELDEINQSEYRVFEPLLEEPQQHLLRASDIKNFTNLIIKLHAKPEPVSEYIYSRLPMDFQDFVDHYEKDQKPSLAEKKEFLVYLNKIIQGENIYQQGRFASVSLSQEMRTLLDENPIGKDLVVLNRYLIEEAFPDDIAKSGRRHIFLNKEHNLIQFYTWGERDCCLPRGATSATLLDAWLIDPIAAMVKARDQKSDDVNEAPEPDPERKLKLNPGDILFFEQVTGAKTGNAVDADKSQRHFVRLTRVVPAVDHLLDNQPVVNIEWEAEDALPFPLCISAIGESQECELIENISVARGNNLLVDFGRRFIDELGYVAFKPGQTLCEGENVPAETVLEAEEFRPDLERAPLTFRQPYAPGTPATKSLRQDPKAALPQISVNSISIDADAEDRQIIWTPRQDLLDSSPDAAHFVVEMDEAGFAQLRFGDGESGRKPDAWHVFNATYRIGNGTAGNVGAETISHLVTREHHINGVTLLLRNPLPAIGGTAPENLTKVKQLAPAMFQSHLERAITTEDYAQIAERHPQVQRAAAVFCWTGSWHKVLVAIDPFGDIEDEDALVAEVEAFLQRYRRIGHEVEVKRAIYIPLDIAMHVCVAPGYLRGHVKAELLKLFSNTVLPDGSRGRFHPDNWTFGNPVRLSNLAALAQKITGVAGVSVTRLQRLFEEPNNEIENGVLLTTPLEIVRLDNDPSLPENGRLEIKVSGGI